MKPGEVEERDRWHLRRAGRGVAVLLERLLDVHDRGLVRRVLELPLDQPVDRLLQERRRLAPEPADVVGALVHGEVQLLEPPGERRPDYPQVRLDERANGEPEQTRDLRHLVRIDRLPALEEREQQPRVVGAHRVVGPRLREPQLERHAPQPVERHLRLARDVAVGAARVRRRVGEDRVESGEAHLPLGEAAREQVERDPGVLEPGGEAHTLDVAGRERRLARAQHARLGEALHVVLGIPGAPGELGQRETRHGSRL